MLTHEQLAEVVQDALAKFYARRLGSLGKLNLKAVLTRKNPYLFRAIGISQPAQLVDALLAAYVSSSDEGLFGTGFFEPLALGVSGGQKATGDSGDVEVRKDHSIRVYAVKSGGNVFNAQSRRRQIQAFEECRRRLTGYAFEAVVGYGYGKRVAPPKGNKNFREVSGQAFWEELSGDPEMYKKILPIIAEKIAPHVEEYRKAYAAALERFVTEFKRDFTTAADEIDWDKILQFNSGKRIPKPKNTKPVQPMLDAATGGET